MAAEAAVYFIQHVDFNQSPMSHVISSVIIWVALFIFSNYVIIYAVYRMRRTIKKIGQRFANESLMIIHFVNFTVYSLFEIELAGVYVIF